MRDNTAGFNVERPRLISKFPRPGWTVCYYTVLQLYELPLSRNSYMDLVFNPVCAVFVEIGINSQIARNLIIIRYSIKLRLSNFHFPLIVFYEQQQFLLEKKNIVLCHFKTSQFHQRSIDRSLSCKKINRVLFFFLCVISLILQPFLASFLRECYLYSANYARGSFTLVE